MLLFRSQTGLDTFLLISYYYNVTSEYEWVLSLPALETDCRKHVGLPGNCCRTMRKPVLIRAFSETNAVVLVVLLRRLL